jgi:hypothetical protein
MFCMYSAARLQRHPSVSIDLEVRFNSLRLSVWMLVTPMESYPGTRVK